MGIAFVVLFAQLSMELRLLNYGTICKAIILLFGNYASNRNWAPREYVFLSKTQYLY